MPEARSTPGRRDPAWARRLLTAAALGFVGLLVALPLARVLAQALAAGPAAVLALLRDADDRHAILLTLLVAGIVVPLNAAIGLAAARAVTRPGLRARGLLVAVIDLPLSVPPVVAGLVFVLVFGLQGPFGPWLRAHGLSIVFALPGIVLATLFVTLPLVARELVPSMDALGRDGEEAAAVLGASRWQTLRHVTLPGVRRALLSGVVLCTARAMGEFGAVSVVSGRIPGRTDTMTLRIETLYNDYRLPEAFAMASLLVLLTAAALAARRLLEHRGRA